MTDYRPMLLYINRYWKRLTFSFHKNEGIRIGLPNPFVSPDPYLFRYDQFYWDSYFIILGLLEEKKLRLAKGMVDNLLFLYKKYGIIPSRNRFYNLGLSQPPFLTSMIKEIFLRTKDRHWLRLALDVAESELNNYWMREWGAVKHNAYKGLSRYTDHHVTHITAEHESGWDHTSRFQDQCLNFLPVDLNTRLYQYEKDISELSLTIGNQTRARTYEKRAMVRQRIMMKLMWDARLGFFFDYDFERKKRSHFFSLAGFYPMWAGMVTPAQAKRMHANLQRFEYRWGLASTQHTGLQKPFRQWDYPNGWAPHQLIVVRALTRYGFVEDAKRIAEKWLNLNTRIFKKTGRFWEKYDVVAGDVGKSGHYKTPSGFGWTNAVFILLEKFLRNAG